MSGQCRTVGERKAEEKKQFMSLWQALSNGITCGRLEPHNGLPYDGDAAWKREDHKNTVQSVTRQYLRNIIFEGIPCHG